MSARPIAKKICLVGDFSVGKTSCVQRFVNQVFAEKYQTTVGVSIETKLVSIANDIDVKLIIWDIAGSDKIDSASRRYLTGADGYLLVVDGTHAPTIAAGLSLKDQIHEILGPVPYVCLLNKIDLTDDWLLSAQDEQSLAAGSLKCFRTSAKTGEHVEDAFMSLATAMIST